MSLPKIDVPTFKYVLPSNQVEITLRLMKAREEKLLLMAKEGGDYGEILASIKTVVNNCLVAPQIDIDTLAIFDIEAAFLKLRAKSVSETTEVAYIDNDEVSTAMEGLTPGSKDYNQKLPVEQRKATHTFTIDLDKVEVKFPGTLEKKIELSKTAGIVLRYPPAGLYSDKEFMSAAGEDLVDLLILRSIDTIYDGKDVTTVPLALDEKRATEIKEWLDTLDVKSYNKIREFFNNLPHLFYEIKYTNKNGKDRVITLTTLNDFFSLR